MDAFVMLDTPPPSNSAFDEDNLQQRLFYMLGGVARGQESVSLLLLRVVDANGGIFERLGCCRQSTPIEGLQDKLLADIEEDVKRTLPCLHDVDGLHTIRII